MTPSHRTDFSVVNERGVTIQTFSTKDRAIAFAEANVYLYGDYGRDGNVIPGKLIVQKVAHRVTRTEIHVADGGLDRLDSAPSGPRDADIAMPGWS